MQTVNVDIEHDIQYFLKQINSWKLLQEYLANEIKKQKEMDNE